MYKSSRPHAYGVHGEHPFGDFGIEVTETDRLVLAGLSAARRERGDKKRAIGRNEMQLSEEPLYVGDCVIVETTDAPYTAIAHIAGMKQPDGFLYTPGAWVKGDRVSDLADCMLLLFNAIEKKLTTLTGAVCLRRATPRQALLFREIAEAGNELNMNPEPTPETPLAKWGHDNKQIAFKERRLHEERVRRYKTLLAEWNESLMGGILNSGDVGTRLQPLAADENGA